MAASLVIKARDATSLKRAIVEITLSGTYTTGGEVTTAGFKKDLSYTKIHLFVFEAALAGADTLLLPKYDYVNDKLMLFRADQVDDFLEQLPNGTAITHVFRGEIVGEGNN